MEKKKVMIVDDEEHFLKIVKINLEMTGKYDVMILSNATDIISRVKKFNPDVILLDILMPDIDGAKTCKMLKEDPQVGKIPVVMLSALDTDKDKSMMYKLGVVEFLVKPIEKDMLIAKINKVLGFK